MASKLKESPVAHKGRVPLAVSLALSGVLGYLAVSWAIQPAKPVSNPQPTTTDQTATLLLAHDGNIDFGTIEQGGYREATVWLENPGPDTVEIVGVRTSCDCFEVVVQRTIVGVGEKVEAVAKIDFRDDPNYRGRLVLEAEGAAKEKNRLAFVINVNVTVGRPR